MKTLTEKIYEAGLVDKHTMQLFERWGAVMPGDIDTVERRIITEKGLEEFAEDIEQLLAQSTEVKETRLDITIKRPPVEFLSASVGGMFSAVEDEMGRLIVSPRVKLHRGEVITPVPPGRARTVLDTEPLYCGDDVYAYQVTLA